MFMSWFQMAHARTGYVVWGKGLNSIMWVKKEERKKKQPRGCVAPPWVGQSLHVTPEGLWGWRPTCRWSGSGFLRSGHRPTVSRFAVLGISPLPLPLFDNATKSFTSLDHLTGLVCWWWWFSIVNFLHSFLKIQPTTHTISIPKTNKKGGNNYCSPPSPSPLHTHTHAPTHIPTPHPHTHLRYPPPPPPLHPTPVTPALPQSH